MLTDHRGPSSATQAVGLNGPDGSVTVFDKGQTMQQTSNRALAPMALAVLALFAWSSTAWAQQSNPLSLSVSERVSYDNNFLRRSEGSPSETTYTTSATVSYFKPYGRQNYSAALSVNNEKHQSFKDFDYTGYSGSVSVNSTIGARGYVSLLHAVSRTQQSPDSQTGARYNDKVTAHSTSFFTQYGVNGRLGINAQVSSSNTEYSVNEFNGRGSVALRLGASFSPSDLLSFGAGVRKSDQTVNVSDEKITRYDYDVNTYWAVTGYSTLSAALALTREQRSIDKDSGYRGATGSLTWGFTPGGKLSYNLSVNRDTGNSVTGTQFLRSQGQVVARIDDQTQTQLTTSLSGGMNWAATSKVNAGLRLTYLKFEDASKSTVTTLFGSQSQFIPSDGRQLNANLSLSYAPIRWLTVGCAVDSYNRKGDRLSVAGFKGEMFSCDARFTLN